MKGFRSTHGNIWRVHRDQAAQAAVESALATPVSLFVVLGMLQMGLVQQARFLTDYAAYRGARAASVARADCGEIKTAEMAALVPTLGRADSMTNWTKTWSGLWSMNSSLTMPFENRRLGFLPIIATGYHVDNHVTGRSFDEYKPGLMQPSDSPEKVRVELFYYYEMNIPFVNWVINRFMLAQLSLVSLTGESDPIHPVSQGSQPSPLGAAASTFVTLNKSVLLNYMNLGHYVTPIYSSWSMRMFSQVAPGSDSQLCSAP